jgi:hypothetical protein
MDVYLPAIRKMHTNRVAPMVERGYREGNKFQWVRETAVNAIDAGATKIEFGVEWQGVNTKGVYRRIIADDGKGMTPEELEEFFNCFGGGGKPIGNEHENFGIGAKTALLPWNHHGVVVISWVNGQPAMIYIMRDEATGEYGLKIFAAEDDEGEKSLLAVVQPFDDHEHGVDWRNAKPSWIDQHGTVIVLLGNHAQDDTFRGDVSRDEDGTKDIARYLNQRLWDLNNVQINTVEFLTTTKANWPKSEPPIKSGEHGVIRRTVRGTEHYIASPTLFAGATLESGMVKLQDNTEIDWYLWSGEPARYHPAPTVGSINVLYRGELYNSQNHHHTYRMFGISENGVRRNLWLIVRPLELTRKPSGVSIREPRATRSNGLGGATCRCRIGARSSRTTYQRQSCMRYERRAAKEADRSTTRRGKNSSRSVSARSGRYHDIGRMQKVRNKPVARLSSSFTRPREHRNRCPRHHHRRTRTSQ